MMNIWTQTRHFKLNENWGDTEEMNGALILLIDELRHFVQRPFVIHCGYATAGHSNGSEHYKGNAIDFHVEGVSHQSAYNMIVKGLKLLQVYDRVGLGAYPEWNNKGFHLDLRGKRARWSIVGGKQEPITAAFIQEES